MEKRPENTRESFSLAESVRTSFDVIFSRSLANPARPDAVGPEKTFRRASPRAATGLVRASKRFISVLTIAERPPRSTNDLRSSFLESAIPAIIGETLSLIELKSSVASSKLPKRISKDWAQPDPMLSPMVLISCVKVRTLVAASSAVFCCSWNILIWASLSPSEDIAAASISPAMIWRYLDITSAESQPFSSEPLKSA